MKNKILLVFLSFFVSIFSLQAASVPDTSGPSLTTEPIKQINLNSADAKILSKSVKGIGLKRAEAIVKYREQQGAFKSVEELASVPGIGKNFVASHIKELQQTFLIQ